MYGTKKTACPHNIYLALINPWQNPKVDWNNKCHPRTIELSFFRQYDEKKKHSKKRKVIWWSFTESMDPWLISSIIWLVSKNWWDNVKTLIPKSMSPWLGGIPDPHWESPPWHPMVHGCWAQGPGEEPRERWEPWDQTGLVIPKALGGWDSRVWGAYY